ncbi:putative phosphoglycerate mutase [Scheffersomyces amazonensis]|uniref:putative phosphoglycerate mutase n=1 Tax=Scheffersomyces amazonensis TaxID=1078765 RepID=UPI00315E005B
MTIDVFPNDDNDVLRVFVVRHGQTDHNKQKILQGHLDIDINQHGQHQAEKVGEFFSEFKIDEFVSSDLIRCQNTIAEITKRQINANEEDIPVKLTSNLRERNMGVVQGMNIQNALEIYGADYKNMGETKVELLSRVENEWNHIIKRNESNKNILICTHGGVITGFFNHLYHSRDYKLNQDLQPHDLKVPFNTSVSVIDINKATKEGTIQNFGSTNHLGGHFEVKDQRLR